MHSADPRRPIMVNRASFDLHAYLEAEERRRQEDVEDMATDILAALAMFAFLAGAGAWLIVFTH